MTKREKTLGLGLLFSLLVVAHFVAASFLKDKDAKQQAELVELKTLLEAYSSTKDSANLIKDEVDWIDAHAPPKISFPRAQTDLENFLVESSKRLGFKLHQKKLIGKPKGEVSEMAYESVQIQIAARATEEQIYKWLIDIHKPESMRILSFLKLSPPIDDSNLINCQIIAEQYITAE